MHSSSIPRSARIIATAIGWEIYGSPETRHCPLWAALARSYALMMLFCHGACRSCPEDRAGPVSRNISLLSLLRRVSKFPHYACNARRIFELEMSTFSGLRTTDRLFPQLLGRQVISRISSRTSSAIFKDAEVYGILSANNCKIGRILCRF